MNIEDLRTLCLQLPAVTEDVKWGNDLVFSVGGKMFFSVTLDHNPASASFKTGRLTTAFAPETALALHPTWHVTTG